MIDINRHLSMSMIDTNRCLAVSMIDYDILLYLKAT